MSMTALEQRSLGAYYTPSDAASVMADWVMRGADTHVLEPSFGDGAFINALREVARSRRVRVRVSAVELDQATYAAATDWRIGDEPILSDFHAVKPFPVDAVLGNPPFVRFRNLPARQALAAREAGRRALGVIPDESGSTWMTIAAHAAMFLKPGGRLALVLPADALYVRYAHPFWRFLRARFGSIRIVRCRERIFPEILQDVFLLFADDFGASTSKVIAELHDRRDQLGQPAISREIVEIDDVLAGAKPFTKALVSGEIQELLTGLGDDVVRADTMLKFGIGYVAGHKTFFHPDPSTVSAFKLPSRSLIPSLRSGRFHTNSGARTSEIAAGAAMTLWLPDPSRLTSGERQYIEAGESDGVHKGYKARLRTPWYVVPGVSVPDVVVPTFGSLPRLMLNDAKYVISNSLMGANWIVTPRPMHLLACWYTSITRLGVELSVHSLGGGVLVLVPRECDAILMPRLPKAAPSRSLLARLDRALKSGNVAEAYRVGDDYLVANGWDIEELDEARRMADELRAWREDR